jgi:invasion protein IalB
MNIKTAALKTVASLGLAAALIALPAATQDATAQDAKPKLGERIGDWVFQCQALSANENICGLVQTVIDNKTKRQVVGVAVRYAGKGETRRLGMFVTVPLGTYLGSGIGGKIDASDQFKFNLQSCNQSGCQGATEIKGAMLTDLKKGERLIIGFKARADSKTIAVPVSLKGFTDGLKAIDGQ